MIDYPNKLNIIFDKLDKFNIKPIIIGGYIRDKLLNLDSKDIDIELYGINSLSKLETILEEFGNVNSVGKSFGVCKLKFKELDIDFSLPRTDSKVSDGHRGFTIKTDSLLDFKMATSRRDFTVNAIGYDVKEKKLLDPFNGRVDLKNGVLKAVDILKFDEDPLRVLRAIQFTARFEFALKQELYLKCKEMLQKNILNELPKDRIFIELQKLLLKSKRPSLGLSLLKELDGFTYFKELSYLTTDEFNELLKRVDYLAKQKIENKNRKLALFLTLMSSDLSQENSLAFLNSLTDKKELISEVIAIQYCKNSINLESIGDYDLFKLAMSVKLESFMQFMQAYTLGKDMPTIETLRDRAKELSIFNHKAEAILQGRDLISLGLKPSPEFSKLLAEAYEAQINSQYINHNEAIEWLKKRVNLS